MVMQLRNLETGAARDVSGVLRVSKGGAWGQGASTSAEKRWEEKEVLYFVQRDGGVSVFGRGE
jgi:elongator complex protein 6